MNTSTASPAVNPKLIRFLTRAAAPQAETASTALPIEPDNMTGVKAIQTAIEASGRKMSQRDIVNTILRAAMTSDAISDAFKIPQGDA
jgi:protein-disulfide isomerase-like protein with CxxC motif